MAVKNKKINIYDALMLVLLLVLVFSKCRDKKPQNIQNQPVAAPVQKKITDDGKTHYEGTVKESSGEKIKGDVVKWHKPSTITNVEISTTVKNLPVPSVQSDSLFLGRTQCPIITYKTENQYIYVQISQDSGCKLVIDSLQINTHFKIVAGTKKSGFLGLKRTPTVTLESDNPYVDVTGLQNINVKYPKPFYQKPLFIFGVGVLAGTLLYTTTLYPIK